MSPDVVALCYARVPVFFWPVLAWNLFWFQRWSAARWAEGCTGIVFHVTWFGGLVIAKTVHPDDTPDWRDSLYRTAMGEPACMAPSCAAGVRPTVQHGPSLGPSSTLAVHCPGRVVRQTATPGLGTIAAPHALPRPDP